MNSATSLNSATPLRVLVIEDNPADAELIVDCFSDDPAKFRVDVAADGAAAFTYLDARRRTRGLPNLILLDLNLPKKSGRQILTELRAQSDYRVVPVVVLTSSDAHDDVCDCYQAGANSYVRKPGNLAGYRRVVSAIEAFWLKSATPPVLC